MMEKFNKIIETRSFEKVGPLALIQDKNFQEEVARSHRLGGLSFARLIFLNCSFIDIDFRESFFVSCDFTNCNFTETQFLKSELTGCNFKNCTISQSDFTKADFFESNFKDCQFESVDMIGTMFTKCEFIQSKFDKECFLASAIFSKSKMSNSKKCIEVNAFDDISKIVDDLKE